MVLPLRGLNGLGMGGYQTEQPVLDKVGVRPALVIEASAASSDATTFAKDASQPHPHPFIEGDEDIGVAMFEVFKPAVRATST
jgi:hypothetical protein